MNPSQSFGLEPPISDATPAGREALKRFRWALLRPRHQQGLSQQRLARKANVCRATLANLERGQLWNPGLQTLADLAEAVGGQLATMLLRRAELPATVAGVDATRLQNGQRP